MPGGDGNGPNGLGPMTGRAAGYCAGFQVPGYANPGVGRGRGGFGRGLGRGFRGGRGGRWGAAALPPSVAAPAIAPEVNLAQVQLQIRQVEQLLIALKDQLASLQQES